MMKLALVLLACVSQLASAAWSDFTDCVTASMQPGSNIHATLEEVSVYQAMTATVVTGAIYYSGQKGNTCIGFESFPEAPLRPQTTPPNRPVRACGSVVGVEEQSLGERIPIVGASFSLNYNSRWAASRIVDYRFNIPLSGPTANSAVATYLVKMKLLGTVLDTQTLTNAPNLIYTYLWNGLDGSGSPVLGSVRPESTFQLNGAGLEIPFNAPLGGFRARLMGVGGWMPSNLHFYDSVRQTLIRGDGSVFAAAAKVLSSGHQLVPEEDGSVVYEFDAQGRHLYTRTGLIGTTLITFNYNGSGFLTSIAESFGRTTLFNRDGSGNLACITAPNGAVTTVGLNAAGLLATVTSPDAQTYTLDYKTSTDLLSSFTKPGGQVSTFTYDADGLVTSDSHSGGYAFTVGGTRSGGQGFTATQTTSMGRTTTTIGNNGLNGAIDGNYNRTVTLPSGATKTYNQNNASRSVTANESGLMTSTTTMNDVRWGNALSVPFARTRGSRNEYISQSASPSTIADPFTYTSVTSTTNVNGHNTTDVFTASSRTWLRTTPVGRQMSVALDAFERVSSAQWAGDLPVSYGYTADKLTSISQGTRTVTLGYDGATGLMTSATNALSQSFSFGYDSGQRLTSVVYPDLRSIGITYDANGNLTGVTPPGRALHSFVLNGHELVGSYQPPSLGTPSVVATGYTYNADKQLTQITRPDAQTITLTYGSSTGLLQSMTTPDGVTSYTYDTGTGLIYNVSAPGSMQNYRYFTYGQLSTEYSYDGNGTLASYYASPNMLMKLGSETIYPRSGSAVATNYAYDNDELLSTAGDLSITRESATGRISATTLDSVTDSWTYNTYGELTGYSASYGTSPLFSYTISRDALGRVDTMTSTVQGVSTDYAYTYDSSARLTDVVKNSVAYSHYNYDSNSNRISGSIGGTTLSATFDAQDRMTANGVYTYTYTAAGELTSKTNTLTSEVTTYDYGVLGNLKSVILPSYITISYDTDGFGRRVHRSLNGSVTSKYIYDREGRLMAELDANGAIVSRFVYGSKPYSPDYMYKAGNRYRMISDQLGSIRLVVDSSTGVVAQKLEYNELGRVLSDSNPGFQPFGFAGGMYDSNTRLVHFGARDYDPESGRWTSKDPILFRGGDVNLYGYVLADPVNAIDPSGTLSPIQWTGVVSGGLAGAFYGGRVGGPWGAGIGFFAGATFGGVVAPHINDLLPPAYGEPSPPPRSEPPLLPPIFNPQPGPGGSQPGPGGSCS